MEIKPVAINFFTQRLSFEFDEKNIPPEKEFWVELIHGRFYIKFNQLECCPTRYEAFEARQGYFPRLSPVAVLQDVVYQPMVTVEAALGLFASLQRANQTQESSTQSSA